MGRVVRRRLPLSFLSSPRRTLAARKQEDSELDASVSAITSWTFVEECPIPEDVTALLVPEERAIAAYKTFRDSAVFTTKRLIVRDAQGLRGKKVEIYSLPYSSINMWSSENAGTLDVNAEIELWTRAGQIKISVGRHIDVRRLDLLIANAVLRSH